MKKVFLALAFLTIFLVNKLAPAKAVTDVVCPAGNTKYEWNETSWVLEYGTDYGVSGDAQTVSWTPFSGQVCLKKATILVYVDGLTGSATTTDHDWSHFVMTFSTSTATPTPTATSTPDPTETPIETPTNEPTSTPTDNPTATPTPSPEDSPSGTDTPTSESGTGGTTESSTTSTPQILGTSTLAKTGGFEEVLMNLVFASGSILSALGIRRKSSH